MSLKKQSCAYCGTTAIPREKGHIIPACMYPSDTDARIQRPTIPECAACKKIWQDAENQFRNIMVIAGTPNIAVMEQWEGPVRRSFDKPSGPRWLKDLVAQMVPVETTEGPRHKVYPANDPMVMLVVKKIIRGLCHYHGIATAVRDQRVWADVLRYPIPSNLRQNLNWSHVGPKFFEYGYEATNDKESNIHSAWCLKFYEQREFVAIVSLSEDGWQS